MRVVVAPDKFRGSATAAQAARALAEGLRHSVPDVEVNVLPVADGGDGTIDAVLAAGFEPVAVQVRGPVGDPVAARLALRRDEGLALVELAGACGLALLPGGRLRPLESHTCGVGDAIAAALELGCRDVLLAVGGSASTDGGLGALTALGARLLDSHGAPVPPGAGGLGRIAHIDTSALDPRLAQTRIRVLTDVDNPLLGPAGCVAVFGPQKGLTAALAPDVEAGLRSVAALVEQLTGARIDELPGGGAAGGIAAVFAGLLGARIVPGAHHVLELLGLRDRLAGADTVVTGEGAVDVQTLHGKAPSAVLELARAARVPALLVAGRVELGDQQLRRLGVRRAISLVDLADGDADRAMRECLPLLRRAGAALGAKLGRPDLESRS